MWCKHRTRLREEAQAEKNMQINDGQISYLKVSSPELWSPKRKEGLMVSHSNSSGCTPSVSLSFLYFVEHQLHQVQFRAGKFGGKNGEELEKGVLASQWPGRRWLLLAELSHLYHKGTAKHLLCLAALDTQKQHLQGLLNTGEEGGVAPHWGTTLEGISPSWQPHTAGQVSTRQMPLEAILLWEKANLPPRNMGSELPPCLQKKKHPFCWKADTWASYGACRPLSAGMLSLSLDWQQKWPWTKSKLLLM